MTKGEGKFYKSLIPLKSTDHLLLEEIPSYETRWPSVNVVVCRTLQTIYPVGLLNLEIIKALKALPYWIYVYKQELEKLGNFNNYVLVNSQD